MEKIGQIWGPVNQNGFEWEVVDVIAPKVFKTKLTKSASSYYKVGLIETQTLGFFVSNPRAFYLVKDVIGNENITSPANEISQPTINKKESEEDRMKRFFFGKTF